MNGRGIPARDGPSPSPIRRTDLRPGRLDVDAGFADTAAKEREHDVLRADVAVPQRVGLALRLDHHLPGDGVEADEEVAPTVLAASELPARLAVRDRSRSESRRRAFHDLVDALMRQLEGLGDLAERTAGGVQSLDRVVVVDPRMSRLALEVDEPPAGLPRLLQDLLVERHPSSVLDSV